MPPTDAQKRATQKYRQKDEVKARNREYMRNYMKGYAQNIRDKAKAYDALMANKKEQD